MKIAKNSPIPVQGLESNVFPERFYVQHYRKVYSLYRSFLDMVLSFASESNRIQGKGEES